MKGSPYLVMAGLVPATHIFDPIERIKMLDASRNESRYDGLIINGG
jgi:hypothetical protein